MSHRNLFICFLVAVILPAGLVQAQFEGSQITVADGFEVRQVYAVPGDTQGSWVALTVDEKGRLIAGDQNGGLFRITLDKRVVKSVEPLNLEVGFVNGLTCAFGSLYAVVAEDEFQGGGLYRIRDLDGDDVYDDVQFLRGFVAKGEHGPHSVIAGPEGKWLYVTAGNKTPVPEGPGFKSLVPPHWGEDDLLPRLWGPIGSEKGTTSPGGWIARTDPEGKSWELLNIGLRNTYDIAFNQAGDLFGTDADAEFDMATAWYQPTRLLHLVTGTDFGWRSGSGKWPPYFADTVPPVYEYGPGSPTGITFGYGAAFPEKYQQALFACDWSWGRIFVSWLKPEGASYTSVTEEFLTGIPLPVADIVVNPFDGAMYFILGGRGTTSGLYQIRYTGPDPDALKFSFDKTSIPEQQERQTLEGLINSAADEEVPIAWPFLSSDDRVLRHTARIILEHVPAAAWQEQALREPDPLARMSSLLGLARSGEPKVLPDLLASLLELDWSEFSADEKLLYLRCLEVAFIRMDTGEVPSSLAAQKSRIRQQLEWQFPSGKLHLNAELLKLLVYLESEKATAPAVDLLEAAVTQEDKLRFILPLRLQTLGWTPPLRERYFKTLGRAHGWTGGLSLTKYLEMIIEDSLKTVSETERDFFSKVIQDSRPQIASSKTANRSFVKLWTLEDLLPVSASELEGGDINNGRKSFTAAGCFACHRVNGEGGGTGPDLSAAMRRFSVRDFFDAVINPSKVISDQYGMSVITKTDGTQIHGRVVNYYGDSIGIQTNSLNAAEILRVPRKDIVSLEQSPISPMPSGLLSTLTREDIMDVVAFLSSGS
jgi:putative heme-binding domain-containing protein